MANNKVQLADGTTLIDLTSDTVTPQTMIAGTTAHAANGEPITGVVNLANAGDAIPLADSGTGAVGSSTEYAREDHVHPSKFIAERITSLDQLGNESKFFVVGTQPIPIGNTGISLVPYSRGLFINYASGDGALIAIKADDSLGNNNVADITTAFRFSSVWQNAKDTTAFRNSISSIESDIDTLTADVNSVTARTKSKKIYTASLSGIYFDFYLLGDLLYCSINGLQNADLSQSWARLGALDVASQDGTAYGRVFYNDLTGGIIIRVLMNGEIQYYSTNPSYRSYIQGVTTIGWMNA